MYEKALVIEDNISDQIMTQYMLESLGFNCVICSEVDEALSFILKQKFDIIFLDLNLPKVTGFQFLLGFRYAPLNYQVPVVIVSSKNDSESLSVSKSIGACNYITKPINKNHLETVVQSCLINDRGIYNE